MAVIDPFLTKLSGIVWGIPLLILLLGGGTFFMIYSRFLPFSYFGHALKILRGKYDNLEDPGEISHFQALSGALAATIGMGNISGVAVAIATGGPGAIFWMWVSAFFGIATKFFTCTLAVMYRSEDQEGVLRGGPMYVIMEGLGKQWKPLAVFFCVAGSLGATPVFQANQLVQVVNDVILIPNGMGESTRSNLVIGLIITVFTAMVIFGGVKRIGEVAAKMVPAMVALYVVSVLYIMLANASEVLPSLSLIVSDAFSGKAVMGGALGALILTGAKRAAFSNEAGIGTAPMMHGAAKTREPVREGLVAMLGPAIDTLVVCTMTGLAILVTGQWQSEEANGITLTARAFGASIPVVGPYILGACVVVFAFTTIVGLSYYGRVCMSFLIGTRKGWYFNYWYVAIIIVGSVSTLSAVVNFIDIAFGLMAIPTVLSAVILAPQVMNEAKRYFNALSGDR